MSLTLTQLGSDNFTRDNVNPLTSPWAIDEYGDYGLQIVSDVCEGANSSELCIQIYDYLGGTPNDQYASATIGSVTTDDPYLFLAVRLTDNGGSFQADSLTTYALQVVCAPSSNSYANILKENVTLAQITGLTVSVGDTFTLAVVGTTLYAFHNSTQIGSVTNTAYASGSTGLGAYPGGTLSYLEYSNFAMGSAATAASYSSSQPFLGSIRIVASAPSGASDPFLGTVVVIGSAPSGPSNPYLGNARVAVSAPTNGPGNPSLGQVVVVASAPSGDPDPYLGNMLGL